MWLALLTSAPLLAALELHAERRALPRRIYLLKPLTTICILLIAAAAPQPISAGYQAAIVAGLLFSLAGDVFLMLPRDRFVAGLASFLLAHLCYSAAFASAAGLPCSPAAALLLAAYGGYLLRRLWPRLGKYRVPVVAYAAVLLYMLAGAHQQFAAAGNARAATALVGAVLFTISDSVLALDRFELGAKRRQLLVLACYFAAQWLIAVSVSLVPG